MNSYYNREKLKNLILYIIQEYEDNLSLTDICNILFQIDMLHYGELPQAEALGLPASLNQTY